MVNHKESRYARQYDYSTSYSLVTEMKRERTLQNVMKQGRKIRSKRGVKLNF